MRPGLPVRPHRIGLRELVLWFLSAALCLTLLTVCRAAPVQPVQGQTKTIAYLERGSYWLFERNFAALTQALSGEAAYRFDFPAALHVSPGWDCTQAAMDKAARTLLDSPADIIIAAGTSAVNTLVRLSDGKKPIIGLALADPIASGHMRRDGVSRYPGFVAEIYPDRWKSMVRVFHNVTGLHRLGIMYPDNPEGRIYAALDDMQAVAREQHFELIEAKIPDESPAACRRGIEQLLNKQIDSFFISPLVCFDWSENDPTPHLKRLHGQGIRTFARDGSHFVRGGALMGFSTWDFAPSGQRLADAVRRILSGTPIDSIRMVVAPEPVIAINLQTARALNFTFPFDVLLVADEIYTQTVAPRMD